MILFVTLAAAALAQTPAQLHREAPMAMTQLEACEDEGCDPLEGAKAAWIVALHQYVANGEANGVLAATVLAVSPDLFADLPDVIQRSATEPMPWVAREPVDSWDDGSSVPIIDQGPNAWRRAREVEISVRSQGGEVIGMASVTNLRSGEPEPVNTVLGNYKGSLVYLANQDLFYLQNDQVEFVVSAPGFKANHFIIIVRKNKNTYPIVLEPFAFAVPSDAPEVAKVAAERMSRWQAAATDGLTQEDGRERAVVESRKTALAAREWMDAGGGEDAKTLCMSTGWTRICGI